jgi:hypothetical protein
VELEEIESKYDMRWIRKDRIYHCVSEVPCRIIAMVGKDFQILALHRDGSESSHTVARESLKHEPCHCFAECRAFERFEKPRPSLAISPEQPKPWYLHVSKLGEAECECGTSIRHNYCLACNHDIHDACHGPECCCECPCLGKRNRRGHSDAKTI